jgi:hypothetical protein
MHPGSRDEEEALTQRSYRGRRALQARCLPYVLLHLHLGKHGSHVRPGFPDPFAVATVNGEQTRTTSVIKKTLNPYWNESFDMYVLT